MAKVGRWLIGVGASVATAALVVFYLSDSPRSVIPYGVYMVSVPALLCALVILIVGCVLWASHARGEQLLGWGLVLLVVPLIALSAVKPTIDGFSAVLFFPMAGALVTGGIFVLVGMIRALGEQSSKS